MAKKMARRNLICFAVLAALLIALCFVNVLVPATNYRFVGFVNAITCDKDISGGYAGKYQITFGDSVSDEEAELEKVINLIEGKLLDYGYNSTTINVNNPNELYIEMPKIKASSSILGSALNKEGVLRITTTSSTEEFDDSKDIIAENVVDAYSMFAQTTASSYAWGVNIDLTSEGKTKLASLTSDASGSTYIYIFVGDTQITQIGPISSQINQEYLFFHGANASADDTNVTALNIMLGTYDVNFELVNSEIIQTAPSINENINLFVWIVLAVVSIALIAVMFWFFGELGYIFTLLYVFFLGFLAFFMQALPIYILSFSGILALMIGIIMFFVSNFVIYNSAKKGFAEGKKIPLAIKLGINNNIMKLVDVSVVVFIASVVMYIFGGAFVASFALTLAMCVLINLFVSILMNKLLTKWYVAVNSREYKKLHFVKGEQTDGNNN